MCLPIDCWLCMPRTVDDDPAPASRTQPAHRNGGTHYTGNGVHNYNGNGGGHHYNGNRNPAAHSRAAAEADRKASNDVRKGPPAQEKVAVAYPYYGGADGTLKQQQPAASNGRVAADGGHGARGGAPHNYSSYERAQQAAHKEDAADSYYPAATSAAHQESPSDALGGQ